MTLLILLTACTELPVDRAERNWICSCAPAESQLTEEAFVLAATPPADVLLVVEPDPDVVDEVLDPLSLLNDDDNRIGVVSSTGGELRWDEDPADLLVALDGDGPNAPLDASYAALEDNPDFRRPDAALHLLIATATDDASALSVDEWSDWLDAQEPAQVAFLGASTVEAFALAVAGARREFFLANVPQPDTLRVEVHSGPNVFGFRKGDDYVYDPARNSVAFFEYAPEGGSTVVVTYDEAP